MKQLFTVFILTITLFSCSSDDQSDAVNPDLLQRVVFFPGKSNETQWNFNAKGLLYEIRNANGDLLENFTYDSSNQVIKDTKHTDDGVITYDITYNPNHSINTINGKTYHYDAVNKHYYYEAGTTYFSCFVNNDGFLLNYTLGDSNPEHTFETNFDMNYENGNMVSYLKSDDHETTDLRIFGYDNISFNDNGNPLKMATLPVLKIKSLIDPDFFREGISSDTPVQSLSFGSENPMSYNYGMLVYPNNHIEQQDIEVFDEEHFVETFTYAKYFYQGQTIP